MAVKARPFDVRHEPEDRYDVRSERNTLNIVQMARLTGHSPESIVYMADSELLTPLSTDPYAFSLEEAMRIGKEREKRRKAWKELFAYGGSERLWRDSSIGKSTEIKTRAGPADGSALVALSAQGGGFRGFW